MIGIIVAEEEELDCIKVKIENIEEKNIKGSIFYTGIINSKYVVVTKGSVGKVNSARTTQMLIDLFNIELIINIGVAGGISSSLKIGDIIIAEKLAQYDIDLSAFGRKLGELPNTKERFFYSDKEIIDKCKMIKSSDQNIYLGVITSGDRFVTSVEFSEFLKEEFGADAVEMEGAAVAQVCTLSDVPFLIIRGISDCPNDENKIDFQKFLVESSKRVSEYITNLIEIL